ncbi:MAG: hypothetical protein H0W89_03555 [Candidatus Levybacteria bacterium]|nr:hypothetical protein [Candidatus Levybacteria bacterium]
MHKHKKTYSTDNLFLAATLSLYSSIESVDFANPRQARFIFESTPRLSTLIDQYWKGELLIEPKALLSQLKIVKSRLYEGGQNG